jgi:hypothetical protein
MDCEERGQERPLQEETTDSTRELIFRVGRWSIYRVTRISDSGLDTFYLVCQGDVVFKSENLFDVYQQCVLRHCQEKYYVTKKGNTWVVADGTQTHGVFKHYKSAMSVATALNLVEAKRRIQ